MAKLLSSRLLKATTAAAAVIAMISTTATAQFLESVPGPYLSGSPTAPYGTQNFQYNCTNTTPTKGACAPIVYILNANPNGQASPSNSQPMVLPTTQVTGGLNISLTVTSISGGKMTTSASVTLPTGASITSSASGFPANVLVTAGATGTSFSVTASGSFRGPPPQLPLAPRGSTQAAFLLAHCSR